MGISRVTDAILSIFDRQEALVRTFGAVHAYEDKEGFFLIAPDRVGFGFICQPLPGMSDSTFTSLDSLLSLSYPPDTILQFCLYASPDVELAMRNFEELRAGENAPILKRSTADRVRFLRRLTEQPSGETSTAKLRDARLVITVQVKRGKGLSDGAEAKKLQDLARMFRATLKTCGFQFATLSKESYLRFMETVFDQGPRAFWRESPWGHADSGQLLCNQILDPDTTIDVHADSLSFGDDAHVRVLSVKRYPDHLYPGMATRYLGDIMRGTKAVRDPFIITLNVIIPDHETLRNKLSSRLVWATRNATGQLSKYVSAYKKEEESLKIANEEAAKGARLMFGYLGCAVISKTRDDAISVSNEVRAMFRDMGFQMMEDRHFLLPLFSQLLPFAVDAEMKQFLMRYRTLPSRHLAALAPVLGSWRGTKTPLMALVARDGQLMTFSPYDSPGGYNFIVAARTGAGKSFLANHLSQNFLAIGGRVWIIDKGGSYKKTCEALGGQYVEFGESSVFSLPLFRSVRNFSEESSMLTNILSLMAAPTEGLTDFQSSALERVLAECWAARSHELTIDDVAAALLEEGREDSRIRDIGSQLYRFTTAGPFGRYFHGDNAIDFNNRFVCLDIQHLHGRPLLQRVVLLLLMNKIQQDMDSLPKSLPKLMLVDEAWNLLASNETQSFIVGWYRVLRKHGACAAICTQSVNDLYLNEGSQAIVENSAHMLLLAQMDDTIKKVKEKGQLTMSDWEWKLLESVQTVPGEYAEIMIRNEMGTGVGRLVESEFNKLLFSTTPADLDAIDRYTKTGLPVADAIERVLADRGRSVQVAA